MLLRVFAEEAFSVGRRIGPERPFISQMSLDPPRHVSEPHWCRVRRRSEGEYSVLRFSVSDLVERDPAVREHELEMHVDTHLRELHQEGPDAVFGVPRLGQGTLFQRSDRALAVGCEQVVATAVRLDTWRSPRRGQVCGAACFEEFQRVGRGFTARHVIERVRYRLRVGEEPAQEILEGVLDREDLSTVATRVVSTLALRHMRGSQGSWVPVETGRTSRRPFRIDGCVTPAFFIKK